MRPFQCAIPTDMVFSYVNGNDPVHAAKRREAASVLSKTAQAGNISDAGHCDIRFLDVGEIVFSVNSVLKYLPWIRTIFIVTDAQQPPLSPDLLRSERVRIVDHRDFIPARYLPTFNNKTIESHLHRIEGLSEIFLYNNDDYMHFSPIRQDFFFSMQADGRIALELHAYPALYRWAKYRYSFMTSYRANLHTMGIVNACAHLRSCRYPLALRKIVMPLHATRVVRRSTALRVEEEFGDILEETRRCKFRDPSNISYDAILYSMEKRWHPWDRLHLYILGEWGAPSAMFDFPLQAVPEKKRLFWQRVAQSRARLACVNNVPPDEREQFVKVMLKKGLGHLRD
jgi:hypothetical protein